MGRTFALSFARLDPTSPSDQHATALLARAAVFAHGETIPRDLLLATLGDEQAQPTATQRADALARLLELGLLESNHEESYRMHRLLAACVERQLGDDHAHHALGHGASADTGGSRSTRCVCSTRLPQFPRSTLTAAAAYVFVVSYAPNDALMIFCK